MKNRFCYLVYCNREPIVYGVYTNDKAARKYAHSLIEYREKRAAERKYEFGYYHYQSLPEKNNQYNLHEKHIFSACLRIIDNLGETTDDGCVVKVVRKLLKSK